jgi:alpha-galactosidase
MVSETLLGESVLHWQDAALNLSLEVDGSGIARLLVAASSEDDSRLPFGSGATGLPLLDVLVSGQGRDWAGLRYSESAVGHRMRYVGHEIAAEDPWSVLTVFLRDPATGLAAAVIYRRLVDQGVLRSSVKLTNEGDAPLTVESVTSLLVSGLAGPGGDLKDVEILWAENDWQAESRWDSRSFREALPLIARVEDGRSRGRFAITNTGSWSSGAYLPMGAARNRSTGHTMLWQIEHNGAWQWQVGEHQGVGPSLSYVAATGPTDSEHHWRVTLAPGDALESVSAALAVAADGLDSAFGRLTQYRRAIRREHEDQRKLPVVFNDYMMTLMGDPSTERLLPLITAAGNAGAEYFCLDAGWYAEPGEDWWDTVGEWTPSSARFTGGLPAVLNRIRAAGMVPGLWLEPEVIGVRSPVADTLPKEAFFVRNDERVVEQGRYHLDLRHPAARAHLDRTIDFLVGQLGVGYFKMDYNIDVGPGTDAGGVDAGVGLLGHNRAFLAWVDEVLDRHPTVTLEACSSGALRADYATLSHFQLQSTSDQEDPLLYPPIAASAAAAIAPEQAGVWAPAQPAMSDDLIAFTVATGLLGRLYLSGRLDLMTDSQQALVAEGVTVYKTIRGDIAGAVPFWPLGLPGWTDDWIAFGLQSEQTTYVLVWRRYGQSGESISLPFASDSRFEQSRVIYPLGDADASWRAEDAALKVTLPRAPSACLVALDVATVKRADLDAIDSREGDPVSSAHG